MTNFARPRVSLPASALTALLFASAGCPADDAEPAVDGTGTSADTSATTLPNDGTGTTPPPTADSASGTGTQPGTTSGSTTTAGSDSTATGKSSTGSDTGAESGTTSGTDTGTDSGGESDTTGGTEPCEVMLPPPAVCADPGAGFPGGFALECDPIAQTGCDAGEKCSAWSNNGGTWNATRCTAVDPIPVAIGGACSVVGGATSGQDNCEQGAMCWNIDAMTDMGTCVETCGCSYDTPICQTPNTVCSISNEQSLTLCFEVCNPLDPDTCEVGQGCYPVGGFFQCAPDVSGGAGAEGDPCEFINVCEPGTVCIGPGGVPGCGSPVGCCASVCDVGDAAPGCPVGTECIDWFGMGSAPDMCLGSVGVCSIPV